MKTDLECNLKIGLNAMMAKNLTTEAAREFLKDAVEVFKGNATALAKKAKVAPTTITRPLNDPDYAFAPKLDTLVKISQAADIPLPLIFRASTPLTGISFQSVQVLGEVRQGSFVKSSIHTRGWEDEAVYVRLYDYDPTLLSAFHVSDNSASPDYMIGSTVIVAPELAVGIKRGDHVVIERYEGSLVETTVKSVQLTGSRQYVFAPINVAEMGEDEIDENTLPVESPNMMVRGVIVGSYREHRSGTGPFVMLPGTPEGINVLPD